MLQIWYVAVFCYENMQLLEELKMGDMSRVTCCLVLRKLSSLISFLPRDTMRKQ